MLKLLRKMSITVNMVFDIEKDLKLACGSRQGKNASCGYCEMVAGWQKSHRKKVNTSCGWV